MDFAALRLEVWQANVLLPKTGLVTMHSGNASGIHRESGLILIKPSGVDYDRLCPEDLAVVDLNGAPVSDAGVVPDGIVSALKPSVDTIHHALLYQADAALGGVIHTHSNYATAWAAAGMSIPCALTAMADEFGDEVPCTPYVDNAGAAHRGRDNEVPQARAGGDTGEPRSIHVRRDAGQGAQGGGHGRGRGEDDVAGADARQRDPPPPRGDREVVGQVPLDVWAEIVAARPRLFQAGGRLEEDKSRSDLRSPHD